MYQIKLNAFVVVYLKTPKLTLLSDKAEHVLLGAIQKFLTDEDTREMEDFDVIHIPAML